MLTVQKVEWETWHEAIAALRHNVFIEEQQVDRTEEFDGLDEEIDSYHFVLFEGGEKEGEENIIGYGRLLGSGKIGRMAVLPAYRNRGSGGKLLRTVALFALKHEIFNEQGKVFLHAQTRARNFYERAGFRAQGETFMEAGIEHIGMQLDPQNPDAVGALLADSVLRFEDASDIHFHLAQVTQCTSRYIDILSDHLQQPIFTHEKFVAALSRAARRSRNSSVRILLRDSKKLHGVGHPLVHLAQRLSSRMEIRALTEEPQKPDIAYLLSDTQRMVYFNNEAEHTGFANYRAGPEAKNILEEFDNLWSRHSKPDPNLKRLQL